MLYLNKSTSYYIFLSLVGSFSSSLEMLYVSRLGFLVPGISFCLFPLMLSNFPLLPFVFF